MAIREDIRDKMKTAHGWSGSSNYLRRTVYDRWYGMFQRCYNPDHPDYKTYGAKGATVCDRWFDMLVYAHDLIYLPDFDKAFADGLKGWQVDKDTRVADNLEYGPDTCMWLTKPDNVNERNRRCGNQEFLDAAHTPEVRQKAAVSQGHEVKVLSPDGHVATFFGAMEAARQLGCGQSAISQACNNKNPHTTTRGKLKGYSFYWVDDPSCPY